MGPGGRNFGSFKINSYSVNPTLKSMYHKKDIVGRVTRTSVRLGLDSTRKFTAIYFTSLDMLRVKNIFTKIKYKTIKITLCMYLYGQFKYVILSKKVRKPYNHTAVFTNMLIFVLKKKIGY